MPSPIQILKTYWGFDHFRPLQEDIIQSVLAGKDTLALLPTGGGKSICYQVPALAQEGICLVISPLIALMKDQVENLKKKGIASLSIYSGMSRRMIVQTLKNAAYGDYKLLYVSPERLETSLFKEYLPALGISLIAVDEAHCISQWGYDFRPSYLKISELREELTGVPVLALTASATADVKKDICDKLKFTTQLIFRQSYQRSNLSYSVFKVDAKIARLAEVISKVQGSSIVYCKSRKRTVELANLLKMHGHVAQFYHAGLNKEERDQRQQSWVENKTKIIVCTNAFGMGIDKADVRLVIHADVPDSLENYYQEAGRAGRDGKKSYAVLLFDEKDIIELRALHNTRFPSFEKIKEVYAALVNFLQIPLNSGEDVSFRFHIETFIRNFKLKSVETLYALKALELDGWIEFNERNYIPSTIAFTTSKQQLEAFQQDHPKQEKVLTTLLRTYDGIFDFPAAVSERQLAQLLNQDEKEVKKLLVDAAAFKVIEYIPQIDEPQIIFRKNRVAINDLALNPTLLHTRKTTFLKRVEKIISYTNAISCRSSFINDYFGELTPACGICDTCLNAKVTTLNSDEFKQITELILAELNKKRGTPQDVISALVKVNKEKTWKVIEFLQSEKNWRRSEWYTIYNFCIATISFPQNKLLVLLRLVLPIPSTPRSERVIIVAAVLPALRTIGLSSQVFSCFAVFFSSIAASSCCSNSALRF